MLSRLELWLQLKAAFEEAGKKGKVSTRKTQKLIKELGFKEGYLIEDNHYDYRVLHMIVDELVACKKDFPLPSGEIEAHTKGPFVSPEAEYLHDIVKWFLRHFRTP
jgi:hypothetical protein